MERQLWIRSNPNINKSPVQDCMKTEKRLRIMLSGENVIELHVTTILIFVVGRNRRSSRHDTKHMARIDQAVVKLG